MSEFKLSNPFPEGAHLAVFDDQDKINDILERFGWLELNNQTVKEFQKDRKNKPPEQPGIMSCGLFNENVDPPVIAGLGLGYAAGIWYRRLILIDYSPAAHKSIENKLPAFTIAYMQALLESIHKTPGMFGPLLDKAE
jgi:hypothetical protein